MAAITKSIQKKPSNILWFPIPYQRPQKHVPNNIACLPNQLPRHRVKGTERERRYRLSNLLYHRIKASAHSGRFEEAHRMVARLERYSPAHVEQVLARIEGILRHANRWNENILITFGRARLEPKVIKGKLYWVEVK